jgi:hypothetical protein
MKKFPSFFSLERKKIRICRHSVTKQLSAQCIRTLYGDDKRDGK